ncbi:hypothetical protein KUTeg_014829 [Tegillarca granosa]|uniref:Uncharacterized protein n=1 Tax=Tegillarca granosa TaxID=220873 RepID=A0ABQ9EW52_TEGGR|nr:hypothetical protein KUTeg_014829 [Tegillarca granosa]
MLEAYDNGGIGLMTINKLLDSWGNVPDIWGLLKLDLEAEFLDIKNEITCFMLEDDELYAAFMKCRDIGAIAMVHAENGEINR